MSIRARYLGPIFWLVTLIAAVAALDRMGSGALQLPAMTREAWNLWLIQSDAIVVTFAMTRLFAFVLAWYLLASTVISFVAIATRTRLLIRFADSFSVPLVRRFARQLAGLSLAGSVALSGPAFASETDQVMTDDVPVLRHVDTLSSDLIPTTTTMSVTNSPPSNTTTVSAPYAVSTVRPVRPEPPIHATYTISPGENFWVVAARVMASRLGRSPSPEEVAWYWRELVERNRDALTDGDNPDLVFPGQILQLP